jgi:hypothetical protein
VDERVRLMCLNQARVISREKRDGLLCKIFFVRYPFAALCSWRHERAGPLRISDTYGFIPVFFAAYMWLFPTIGKANLIM